MRFIPNPTPGGGSRIGSSYLAAWAKCPRLWFESYYRPFKDGRGLQPIVAAPPLRIGRLFHEALAAWYLSGCRDGEDSGEYDVDAALAALHHHWELALPEYRVPEEADHEREKLEVMVRAYHDMYGPRGPARDWPDVRVAHDSLGQPIIERELLTEIAPGYYYTARLDGLMWERGYLRVWEHKTTTAWGVQDYLDSVSWGAQFTGEVWCVAMTAPAEEPLVGVTVNVCLKERSRNSKYNVAERSSDIRTHKQLERWRLSVLHTLAQIDMAVGEYERARERGVDPTIAADQWFPLQGQRSNFCRAYGRPCDYRDLCLGIVSTEAALRQFRPRTQSELTLLQER